MTPLIKHIKRVPQKAPFLEWNRVLRSMAIYAWLLALPVVSLIEAAEPNVFGTALAPTECTVVEDSQLSSIRGKYTGIVMPNRIVIDGVSVILWDEVGGGKPPRPDTQINIGSGGVQNNRVLLDR